MSGKAADGPAASQRSATRRTRALAHSCRALPPEPPANASRGRSSSPSCAKVAGAEEAPLFYTAPARQPPVPYGRADAR